MTNDQQDRAYRLAQIAATLMAGPTDYGIDAAVKLAAAVLYAAEAHVRAEVEAEADKRRLSVGGGAE